MSCEAASEPQFETPFDATILPITEYVYKLVSPCNLSCDYCYEYVDPSWKDQPPFMDLATLEKASERVNEHAAAHGLDAVRIILHGGEPLMYGRSRIDTAASIIRSTIDARVALQVQTNGTLLDEKMLATLARHDIRVGLSIDGDKRANDRHRLDLAGKSSYLRTMRAIALLREASYDWGILGVIDPGNDPVETYKTLATFGPRRMDLLLPHGNWSTPPPRLQPGKTPYADWLIPIFDHYNAHPELPSIRTFKIIIEGLLGQGKQHESLGNRPPQELFIRPDGSYEHIDTLRSTKATMPATGLNIFEHSVSDVTHRDAQMLARRSGNAALSQTCLACPVLEPCGGGYRPHRYDGSRKPEKQFTNPSVFCADLFKLITYIKNALDEVRATGVRPNR